MLDIGSIEINRQSLDMRLNVTVPNVLWRLPVSVIGTQSLRAMNERMRVKIISHCS